MSFKFLDDTGLSYFWGKIKAKLDLKQDNLTTQTAYTSKGSATKVPQITTNNLGQVTGIAEVTITQPTKTSDLTNDKPYNYSVEKALGTIDDLAAFTSGKPGLTGSMHINQKESGVGAEIPDGWYNYYFSPHRTGIGSGDNPKFGNIIITPMNFSGKSWILRRNNNTNSITEVKSIATGDIPTKTSDLTNDSDFATHQDIAEVTLNDLAVIASKEYSGIIGTANNQDNASYYFANLRPTNFYDVWRVKYKVTSSVPSQDDNYRQYSIVEWYGNQTSVSYSNYNRLFSGSYVCYKYHNIYRLNSTGYTNNYSHALGVGLRDATNGTDANYTRNFKIEILETENCTVTMYDTMIKKASISGQGSTNFDGVTETNGSSNGLQETGDSDTIYYLRYNGGAYITFTNLYRYMICFSKNETTLLPVNAVSNSVATNKALTTEEFNPFGQILYYHSTTTVNANATMSATSLYLQRTIDLRYSFNTGQTLIDDKDVFIVCVPQSNGMVKLHSSPISQTLPTTEDGLVYIYLGHTFSTYQIEMYPEHPVYEFKNGALRLYTNDSNKQDTLVSGTNIKTINNTSLLGSGNINIGSGGTSTDVQVNGTSITSGGVANIATEGTYNSSSNKIATMSDITGITGLLANLSTTDTSSLVAALNEVLGIANIQTEYVGDVQGRYIKFGNGLMICYNSRTMQIPIRTAQGNLYYGDKNLGNLPATFTSTPVVLGIASGDSHGWVERIYGSTTTFWGNMRVLRTSQTDTSGYNTNYNYFAIGFWK